MWQGQIRSATPVCVMRVPARVCPSPTCVSALGVGDLCARGLAYAPVCSSMHPTRLHIRKELLHTPHYIVLLTRTIHCKHITHLAGKEA